MCGKEICDVKSCKAILKQAVHSNKNYRREKRFYYCELCKGHHLTSKEEHVFVTPVIDVKEKEKWKQLLELE